MIHLHLNEAAGLLQCDPMQVNSSFTGVETDSRKVKPGMLFAALQGSTFDGHDYIQQATEQGASAVLLSRHVDATLPVLLVEDVLMALGTLAGYWRKQCRARVVAVTGSNGKTTVKEMIASILRQNANILATTGNFNNELGLPLTLFQLSQSDDYAVIEMGANKPGDIAYLAGIAQPDVGLITNIGPAHLKGFISVEGVARSKGELYASLPRHGTAIMNAAEPWIDLWLNINSAGTVSYFNVEGKNNVYARDHADGVIVSTPVGEFALQLDLPGQHNVTNALSATVICMALGISIGDIQSGLAKVKAVPGRLNMVQSSFGWTVIDDTYNANPASLYAALQVLTKQSGEPWLVLGDMKELGSDSRKIHAELGDAARSLGVKRLFALGDASAATVTAFGASASHFESRDGLIEALVGQLKPGVACLVKGSRSMGMEHVVKAISNDDGRLEVNG